MPYLIYFLPKGELTIKHLLTLLLVCVMILLTGCDFISFSVDELLTAPGITEEQSAIYQALIAMAGRDVRLEYPRGGNSRSAFILQNIDSDEQEEAIAFYSYSEDDSVRICVMDKTEQGGWSVSSASVGKGTTVEKVYINSVGDRVDIIVSYGMTGYGSLELVIYRYHTGSLVTIHESTCTLVDVVDFNSDGLVEVLFVSKNGIYTKATVITNADGLNYTTHEADFTGVVMATPSYAVGELYDDYKVVFIDTMDESGYVYTEILYMTESGLLLCPSSSVPGMRNATRRQYGYYTVDYDGDGRQEVPLTEAFIGYSGASEYDTEYMTAWMDYDHDRFAYSREAYSYYHLEDEYVFKLPNRWVGVVSVIKDDVSGEITFVKYDPDVAALEEMTPIISFLTVDSAEEVEAAVADGYRIVTTSGYKTHLVKTVADESEPLVLTADEINNNFHTVRR